MLLSLLSSFEVAADGGGDGSLVGLLCHNRGIMSLHPWDMQHIALPPMWKDCEIRALSSV